MSPSRLIWNEFTLYLKPQEENIYGIRVFKTLDLGPFVVAIPEKRGMHEASPPGAPVCCPESVSRAQHWAGGARSLVDALGRSGERGVQRDRGN